MPILNPEMLGVVDKPELFFGIVGAVGTPLKVICREIKDIMESKNYQHREIFLSDFLVEAPNLSSPIPKNFKKEYERVNMLMDRGNELRKKTGGGEALALIAVSDIHNRRSNIQGTSSGMSYVFCQLKHPDEIFWLRRIYDYSFQLIGVYCSTDVRKRHLIRYHGMNKDEAEKLIKRDAGEEEPFGQQLRDTFHLSDVFIEMPENDRDITESTTKQLNRYFNLLFSDKISTPTVDEYGMYLASNASLRSSDLSRQVGSAIINESNDVISLGANEVPASGGGQYWEGSQANYRDFEEGHDPNHKRKKEIIKQVLDTITFSLDSLTVDDNNKKILLNEISTKLRKTLLYDLTEFTRAVHAEMEAILSAGRIGVSVKGCCLYTTTFPCHNCTKHIISSGINRVVYIEPYPKSLATELHHDSISHEEQNNINKIAITTIRGWIFDYSIINLMDLSIICGNFSNTVMIETGQIFPFFSANVLR